jgi:tetratricopeptide (TPR) repeat protein
MAADLGSADPALAARMHQALGGVYLDRSRVKDALREFAAALRLDPDRADLYTFQGLAYSQTTADDPVAATQAFQKASALEPRDPVRAYVLARQLTRVRNLPEARKAFQLVVEGRPGRTAGQDGAAAASPFIRLGLVPEKSRVEPFFPPLPYAEGFKLLQQGDYDRALASFRDAAARDPLAAPPVEPTEALGRAAAAFREGMVAIAIGHLKVALELTPDRAEAHRMLGRVYLAGDEIEAGREELRTAIRMNPRDERARLALADSLVNMEQYPEAEKTLAETLQALPASGRARYALARLYQRQGRQVEALREFERAVAFKPLLGLNGIYQTMGAMSAARQNFDAAVDAYEKRVDIHPNDADAHQDLGETYARLSRHDEALAEFSVALMLDPRHSAALAATAQIRLKAGRYGEAVEAANAALAIEPAHRQARYTLGTSLMRLGRTDEGQKELDEFQRLQAADAEVHARELELGGLRREASVSAASGDHEKAVSLLRKVLALEPDAISHLNLGLALLGAGHPAEAIDHFKSAITLDGPIESHLHLSEAYSAQGLAEESRRELAAYDQLRQETLRRAGANR